MNAVKEVVNIDLDFKAALIIKEYKEEADKYFKC